MWTTPAGADKPAGAVADVVTVRRPVFEKELSARVQCGVRL